MTTEERELIQKSKTIEEALKDPEKPADLTPEQSKQWDESERYWQKILKEGPMSNISPKGLCFCNPPCFSIELSVKLLNPFLSPKI